MVRQLDGRSDENWSSSVLAKRWLDRSGLDRPDSQSTNGRHVAP